jgi:hypothetical protein
MDSRFPDMKWKIKKRPSGEEEWRLIRPSSEGERDQLVAGFYCGPGIASALARFTEDQIERYRTAANTKAVKRNLK